MNWELEGKLIEKQNTQEIERTNSSDGKKFRKREFVIEFRDIINGVESQYPNFAKFQVVQDKCELLDRYNMGDKIKVSFNVRGSKYINREGRESYITNLNAWRVEYASAATQPANQPAPQYNQPAPQQQFSQGNNGAAGYGQYNQYNQAPSSEPIDDLPF